MSPNPPTPPLAGGDRGVLEAALLAARAGVAATLVVVLATDGSTYVRAGAIALFGPGDAQVGWLSGGCIEPDIARLAAAAAEAGQLGWMEIETRNDEDLFGGSAVGCRGHLRLAMLPLQRLPGFVGIATAWLAGDGALLIEADVTGRVQLASGTTQQAWALATVAPDWDDACAWRCEVARPLRLLLAGAGPETPVLLPLLRMAGWITTVAERRERWLPAAALAEDVQARSVAAVLAQPRPAPFDAALVMHHNFELDREALDALAPSAIPFVGLLGPVRRREDLFAVLPAQVRDALAPRLHSPVGLPLGGLGAEAIALSIAAQLQQLRVAQA